MSLLKSALMVSVLVLAGCAHSTMRGSVAMKVSDNEAHVCMGDDEVKAGDKVIFYKSMCRGGNSAKAGVDFDATGCEKVRLGEGMVEKALNHHYSLVKVNSGVQFDEGTIVEKQ